MVIGYNVSLYELSVVAHTNPHHDPAVLQACPSSCFPGSVRLWHARGDKTDEVQGISA